MGSQQQFCLRWNNHQTNLVGVFEELLQQETLVDVTLACEGHTMKAHKVVLSACSPYFRHIFVENPCKHPVIILKDVKFDDMKVLVDFMYKGEVNVSQDQLSTLLNVAETLKVKGLAEVTESMSSQVDRTGDTHARVTLPTTCAVEPQPSIALQPYPLEVIPATDGRCTPPQKRRKRVRRPSGGSHSEDSRGPKEQSNPSHDVALPIVPKTEVVDISYDDPMATTSSCIQDNKAVVPSPRHTEQQSTVALADVTQDFDDSIETEPFIPCQQQLVELEDSLSADTKAQPSTSSDQSSMYFPSTSSRAMPVDVPSVSGTSTMTQRASTAASASTPHGSSGGYGDGVDRQKFYESDDSRGLLDKKRNLVWYYFAKVGSRSQCNICKKLLTSIKLSNMKSHLQHLHEKAFEEIRLIDAEIDRRKYTLTVAALANCSTGRPRRGDGVANL